MICIFNDVEAFSLLERFHLIKYNLISILGCIDTVTIFQVLKLVLKLALPLVLYC